MNTAELIAALEEVLVSQRADTEGYYTSKEWAKMMGVTTKTALSRLEAVKEAGRLSRADVSREDLDGTWSKRAGYRILPG